MVITLPTIYFIKIEHLWQYTFTNIISQLRNLHLHIVNNDRGGVWLVGITV